MSSGSETVVFGVSNFFLEPFDLERKVCENSDNFFNVRNRSHFLEDVERNCEGSEQQLGGTSTLCRCSEEGREHHGEMKFGTVTGSSGSEWRASRRKMSGGVPLHIYRGRK